MIYSALVFDSDAWCNDLTPHLPALLAHLDAVAHQHKSAVDPDQAGNAVVGYLMPIH
jgi:hypothetical protein